MGSGRILGYQKKGWLVNQNSMLQVVQVVSHVLLNWFKQMKNL